MAPQDKCPVCGSVLLTYGTTVIVKLCPICNADVIKYYQKEG
jgi:hypothetical protein